MGSERAHVNRSFARKPGADAPSANREVVTFRDEWGALAQTFDVAKLGLSRELTALFADAFRMHYAGATAATRKGCWKALRAFARFIAEDGGITVPANLTTDAVGRYILWLDRQRSGTGEPWSISTRYGRFVHVKTLLIWAMRNRPGRLPISLSFPCNPFPGRHRTPVPRRLSAPQLKAILGACYAEIDAGREDFEKDPSTDAVKSRKPRRPHIADAIVPFFLAIGIQTAANPEALRLIRRDCLVPHPLDEDRVVIDWAKPRAGGEVRRAQRRSFDRRRPYAAPNLIDRVAAITEPLVATARPSERNHLFLVRGNHPVGVGTIRQETLRIGIQRFIARANARVTIWNNAHPDKPRALLPNFAPVLFRGSVATQHYRAAGGDIRVAQAVLNHARPDTTDLYVRGPETQRLQEATVARLQNLMVAWITGGRSPGDPTDGAKAVIASGRNTEAFGYLCANPLAGVAPGAIPGRLCPRFGGCLTCPGLVIPIDAEHLARILQAKCKLESARERIHPDRWQLLYAPSHRILTEDILPDFPADLHAAAERIILALPSLPDLE
jgi:integrase